MNTPSEKTIPITDKGIIPKYHDDATVALKELQMLPPYGKILKAYLDANIILPYAVSVFVGKDAYKEAKALLPYQICLCLPKDKSPETYQWPVKDLRLIVYDTGSMTITELESIAVCLFEKGGAQMITIHSHLYPANVEIFI